MPGWIILSLPFCLPLADDSVNCAVITGAGKTFSAGGDFAMVREITESFEARTRVWREARDLVYNIVNCRKPVVSAMRGVAVGAGLVCGILADVSIATPDCRITDGHTRLGVAAGDHAAIIWPLLCGMAKAKYYLLTCDVLQGVEADVWESGASKQRLKGPVHEAVVARGRTQPRKRKTSS